MNLDDDVFRFQPRTLGRMMKVMDFLFATTPLVSPIGTDFKPWEAELFPLLQLIRSEEVKRSFEVRVHEFLARGLTKYDKSKYLSWMFFGVLNAADYQLPVPSQLLALQQRYPGLLNKIYIFIDKIKNIFYCRIHIKL